MLGDRDLGLPEGENLMSTGGLGYELDESLR